jgi:hypothetical protein
LAEVNAASSTTEKSSVPDFLSAIVLAILMGYVNFVRIFHWHSRGFRRFFPKVKHDPGQQASLLRFSLIPVGVFPPSIQPAIEPFI